MDDLFQLAVAAHRAGDFDVAEQRYRALPASRNAQHNLAVVYKATGRYDEAEAAFRRLLADKPDDQHARHSLSHILLALERFEEAWPLWEARRNVSNASIFEPVADYPEWRGEAVRGKRVVVCGEHGLGDQVLFGRYLDPLREMGAEVTVACNVAAVGRLFEHAGYLTRPYSATRRQLPHADHWVFIGSLPLRLGVFAPPAPDYLKFPLGAGGGIGVMGQGDRRYAYDAHRSMPAEAAAELMALGRSLDPAATGVLDVYETAQIIAGLDAVVSTDTLAPNLSASMGKRTLVLLSAIAPCWRWGVAGRSPWYPDVEIYRQPAQGAWGAVVEQVRADLGRSGDGGVIR